MLDASAKALGGLVLCAGVVALAARGFGGTDPDDGGPPRVTPLGAPAATDSIDAQPAAPYVVRVRNGDGSAVAGTSVTFGAVNAAVSAPGGTFASSAVTTTDSRGETAVFVRFGAALGAGSIVAHVTTLALADTLEIEVLPGARADVAIIPADTAILVGASFSASASAVDRRGNPVGGGSALTVVSGPVAPSGGGFVGTGFGTATLSATVGTVTRSATVRVVPEGQIAFTRRDGGATRAWLATLHGYDETELSLAVPSVREPSVTWNPAGTRIVLGGSVGFTVFDLGTSVQLPGTWPGGLAGSDVLWPRFGPGDTIYYSSADGAGEWDLRKMTPEGDGAAIVIPTDRFPNNDFFPDWAPDRSAFVFAADWEENDRYLVRISDPTATTIETIDVEISTPKWSPDGAWIAYQELGAVGVVSPDGLENREWSLGWSKGVTWSPGSDMLVGIATGQIALIDIDTGETVTLPHLGSTVQAVAWRPQTP